MKKAKKACLLRVWPTFDPKSLGSEWPRLISHIRYKIWQRVSPVNIINDSNTVFPPNIRHLYYLVTELFSNTALVVLNSMKKKTSKVEIYVLLSRKYGTAQFYAQKRQPWERVNEGWFGGPDHQRPFETNQGRENRHHATRTWTFLPSSCFR